jgi:hypothetical protein
VNNTTARDWSGDQATSLTTPAMQSWTGSVDSPMDAAALVTFVLSYKRRRSMLLTELCVSLDLARELAENGYPQDTYFLWQQYSNEAWYINESSLFDWASPFYAAPTVSELQKAIDWNYRQISSEIKKEKYGTTWELTYYFMYDEQDEDNVFIEAESFEGVMVEFWIWLKNNNYFQRSI